MTHEMRFDLNGGGPHGGGGGSELQRIDAMRRTFTARRFGSGYDAIQVNRLFDAIIASLSGRSNMPLNESELDPNQFSLVPGGYFEAEVNQALREVRDLVREITCNDRDGTPKGVTVSLVNPPRVAAESARAASRVRRERSDQSARKAVHRGASPREPPERSEGQRLSCEPGAAEEEVGDQHQEQERGDADEEDLLDAALVVAEERHERQRDDRDDGRRVRAARPLTVGRCWSGEVTVFVCRPRRPSRGSPSSVAQAVTGDQSGTARP